MDITTYLQPAAVPVQRRSIAIKARVPLYIYAVSLASLFTVIGILWDISWHKSIGRDKFLSPPHILIYLGAIFAGLFSGIQVLVHTFRSGKEGKEGLVRVWGVFYSSLGALFCIWGAIAMLTSAPFDDWWHSAYGLDVTILSPPHTLLGMGMLFLQFGACVSLSKYLNRAAVSGDTDLAKEEREPAGGRTGLLQFLFIVCAASLLCMLYVMASAYLRLHSMRSGLFYIVASFITLLFMPAFGRALRMRWGMTAVALGYFLIAGSCNWILQLFPAEPKLGPILTHTTHFQPSQFPLLIILPAIAMDWLLQRSKASDWTKAWWLSLTFVGVLLAVQYPLSGFLLESPIAHGWFFGSDSYYFGLPPDNPFRYKFQSSDIAAWPVLLEGLGIAGALGFIMACISLRWGRWMQSVQR